MNKPSLRSVLLFVCATLVLLGGCTYHGKIHRGIYQKPDYEEKINARVMVVADKFFPQSVTLEGDSAYHFRLSDGLPVAVADALGTLFTEVEVNEYKYRKNYDYIAELDYKAALAVGPAEIHLQNTFYSHVVFHPVLQTYLTLTMRNPQTGYAVARYTQSAEISLKDASSSSLLWLTGFLRIITLGLLTPLDVQAYGGYMRGLLEEGIVKTLSEEIMPQMQENRVNFTKEHLTEKSNVRVDGQFIPFMQATVYIHTDDAIGSGFLISPDGYIITNRHVVGTARDVSVVLYDQRQLLDKTDPSQTADPKATNNKVRFAKVLKSNKARDLALLKMEGENLPYLELETDRSAYTTGQEVVALGAPRGVEWSASRGILSAARDNNGVDTLQTDAAINNGNSGGPLISLQTGRVLGVNSWGMAPSADIDDLRQGVQNINFAISAYEVQRTLGVTQPVDPDDFPLPTD